METELLTTSDGHELAADLATPDRDPAAAAVICHPHPQYGGNRFNPVVDTVFRHLPALGIMALRFDFRAAFDGGVGERQDIVAAVDELRRRTDAPVVVVGYSFGAAVALNTADKRITDQVAIAPPLTMMDVAAPSVPTLVMMPRHDQFTDVDHAQRIVAAWPDAELKIIESTDHSLTGRTTHVAEVVGDRLVTVG